MLPTKVEGQTSKPWEGMSIKELEREYSPSQWSKRCSAEDIIGLHVKTVTCSSKAAKDAVPNRLDVPYGSGPRMKVDVFGEDLPKGWVFVYVHGGYWQELHKDISSYVVEPLYKNGILTVIVGYDEAPQVTMEKIISEVREAVIWSCDLAKQRGSLGIILAGHSAGGHLITEVLSTRAEQKAKDLSAEQRDLIKGAIPISGVFDLRPLVKTYINDPLKLTTSSAWSLSPLGKIRDLGTLWHGGKLLVAVGEEDSPEFQRQSKQYFEGCVEAGLRAEFLMVEKADHFNIVEDLAKSDFALTHAIIDFVKKCPA